MTKKNILKKGDKVFWIDPVNGKSKMGIIQEECVVVAEAEIDDLNDIGGFKVKRVNRESWEVLGNDGSLYAVGKSFLSKEKPTN